VPAVSRADQLLDDLLAHGRHAITTAEAAASLGVPEPHVRVRFHRLARRGKVFSPARGLWVAVPPSFRSWGTLPGLQFIDALMNHLGREYYVGWLSAAELHGAAHQRPQVLQVAVDRHTDDRDLGGVHLRFVQRRHVAHLPRVRQNTPTGQVWVATTELTALDLADAPRLGGGLNNVATVLGELAESGKFSPDALTSTAEHFPLSTQRRLGYLLECVGAVELAEVLHPLAEQRRAFPADLLAPDAGDGANADANVDKRWRLVVNTHVDPDL
jgi:predicted transcriptional regulator of viral defense system